MHIHKASYATSNRYLFTVNGGGGSSEASCGNIQRNCLNQIEYTLDAVCMVNADYLGKKCVQIRSDGKQHVSYATECAMPCHALQKLNSKIMQMYGVHFLLVEKMFAACGASNTRKKTSVHLVFGWFKLCYLQ